MKNMLDSQQQALVQEHLPIVHSVLRYKIFSNEQQYGMEYDDLYPVARKLLVRDKRSSTEQQIIHLSKQTLLSTAEIIRCAELQVSDLPTEEAVLDALYGDDITTSDNLADTVRYSRQRNNVLAAISNLYLRRQITFERI